jgi:hypothetical protein
MQVGFLVRLYTLFVSFPSLLVSLYSAYSFGLHLSTFWLFFSVYASRLRDNTLSQKLLQLLLRTMFPNPEDLNLPSRSCTLLTNHNQFKYSLSSV